MPGMELLVRMLKWEAKRPFFPYCGKCVEHIRDLNDFSYKCLHCVREYWAGPLSAIVGHKDAELKTNLVSEMEGMPLYSGTIAAKDPKGKVLPKVAHAEMLTVPSPILATRQECVPSGDPSGGGAIVCGRGHGHSSTKSSQLNEPYSLRSVTTKDCEMPTLEIAPGWEEHDTLSAKDPPSKVGSHLERPHALSRSSSLDNNAFWVCPGRANPKIFRTVSRVQRIINFRVHELWGFYMPYAPEWVYDEVEKHLDEWIYGRLCRKKHVGPQGLFYPDHKKREQDLSFFCDIVGEWWFGRTILKNHVKSCGKYSKEKYFSISVLLPNKGRIDKPNPKYYLSYEHTLAKCGLLK